MTLAISSVSGFLSLLSDKNSEIRSYALNRLLDVVDIFWPEISDSVDKIEVLFETEKSKLAALLASKVYYHLDGFQESLNYALHAEELFDLNKSSDFVEKIVSKCIDRYIDIKSGRETVSKSCALSPGEVIDVQAFTRLENVVQRMFERSLELREYKNALGIAIETRRMDIVERIMNEASPTEAQSLLRMAYRISLSTVGEGPCKKQLLTLLINLHIKPSLGSVDLLDLFNCLIALMDASGCVLVFFELLTSTDRNLVTAYQAGFDMLELGNQGFLARILNNLYSIDAVKALFADDAAVNQQITDLIYPIESERLSIAITSEEQMETTASSVGLEAVEAAVAAVSNEGRPVDSVSDGTIASSINIQRRLLEDSCFSNTTGTFKIPGVDKLPSITNEQILARLNHLTSILNGDKRTELIIQFLIRNNHTDMKLLDKLKADVRQSVTHNATVIANGFMHFGTTSDQFLRDNLEWLARAVNWAKFTATASLGVIHRGHERDALSLMEAYLPKDQPGGNSPYTEGGGLYALGLIHAGHGRGIRAYLLEQVAGASVEQVRHGGLLGLGLACMCTGDADCTQLMRDMLMHDDAVIGEAAAIGLGLVAMGSLNSPYGSELFNFLLQYAHDTKHDKIIRSCALACALICFEQHSGADWVINTLCNDPSAAVRTGGAAAIAMAYCGTSNAGAVRRLLHLAVTDTGDDVKRYAVIGLGFVLCNWPERVPSVVKLLAESYNPHLRYGSAMAVGLACAGTGLKEALAMVQPMMQDRVHYVRQGAFITMAMLTMQLNAVTCPQALEVRDKLLKVTCDKHEELISKFGAALALGILNAGGRNVTISLQNRTGGVSWQAAAGLLLFQSHWHWFPLAHTVALAFQPTSLMVLNGELKMPRLNFSCQCKPSTFAYMPPLQADSEKKRGERSETVVLSVTAKEQKRAERRKEAAAAATTSSSTPATPLPAAGSKSTTTTTTTTKPSSSSMKTEEKDEEKEKEAEPSSTVLHNPARVLPMQARFISLADTYPVSKDSVPATDTEAEPSTNGSEVDSGQQVTSRYKPVRPLTTLGIILLYDERPGDNQELVEILPANRPHAGNGSATGAAEEDTGPEPDPPQAFDWTEKDEEESFKFFNNAAK